MQAVYLQENPRCEVVLQALRIGELGIATFPNEVYGLTGLKIKLQSPLARTMNIELANGAAGYIPPPEQHRLGGYNTWPARTAGLEVQAEPKMVDQLLGLLEKVSGRARQEFRETAGETAQRVLADGPQAYYRLAELSGDRAEDASGHGHHARHVGHFAYHLDGPASPAFAGESINRAVHCVGGRLETPLKPGDTYSIEMWFFNGMPASVREITGTLLSIGDQVLAISGNKDERPGRLMLGTLRGSTVLERYRWYRIVLVRDGDRISVYLNDNPAAEFSGDVSVEAPSGSALVFGASADNQANFEGRLDEIAVFDRVLSATEIARHWPER
jgi:hypothetical protein